MGAERTFLHWARVAEIFAAASATILAGAHAADLSGQFLIGCGMVCGLCSAVVLIHAYRKHVRRAEALSVGRSETIRPEDFADRRGAYLLVTCLTLVVGMLVVAPTIPQPEA